MCDSAVHVNHWLLSFIFTHDYIQTGFYICGAHLRCVDQ